VVDGVRVPSRAAPRPPPAAAGATPWPARRPRNHRPPRCVVPHVPRSEERGTLHARPRLRPGTGARGRAV